MARRTAKRSTRGAVPSDGSRIRNEVAAIALAAFAVLTLVALFADANAASAIAATSLRMREPSEGTAPRVVLFAVLRAMTRPA